MFFHREMELSLIGLQNAGKSSLVNVLTTGAFHEDMIPTARARAGGAWQGGGPSGWGGLWQPRALWQPRGRAGLRRRWRAAA